MEVTIIRKVELSMDEQKKYEDVYKRQTCSCGNNSLQILKMVIRRHVILVTADSVCGTVVGNVYHNVTDLPLSGNYQSHQFVEIKKPFIRLNKRSPQIEEPRLLSY